MCLFRSSFSYVLSFGKLCLSIVYLLPFLDISYNKTTFIYWTVYGVSCGKCCCSVAKSCPTLWPHGLQHARLLCPSLFPGVCSGSCPLSRWCHSTTSSSVTLFSSCPQSFPASGSFPVSWLFVSGGQSTGASASVLPMNIQGWFPLRLTGLISLTFKGFSSLLHYRNLKASVP